MTDAGDTRQRAALQELADATAVFDAAKAEFARTFDLIKAEFGNALPDISWGSRLEAAKATAYNACFRASEALDRAAERVSAARKSAFGFPFPPSYDGNSLVLLPFFRALGADDHAVRDWRAGLPWLHEESGRVLTRFDTLTLWKEGIRVLYLQHSHREGQRNRYAQLRLRDMAEIEIAMQAAFEGVAPAAIALPAALPPPTLTGVRLSAECPSQSEPSAGRVSKLELD